MKNTKALDLANSAIDNFIKTTGALGNDGGYAAILRREIIHALTLQDAATKEAAKQATDDAIKDKGGLTYTSYEFKLRDSIHEAIDNTQGGLV